MLLHILFKGGIAMYLLFACSIWGVYLVVYRFLYLMGNQARIPAATAKVKSYLHRSGREQTIDHLSSQKGIVNRLLHDALKNDSAKRGELHEPITEITHHELLLLEKNLSIISTIVTAAPMLGLFGTVLGLIRIFNVVAGGTFGDPSLLAGGIAEALLATVTGLTVAIGLMFPYQILAHNTDSFILDMQHAMNEVLEYAGTQKE